MCRMNTTNRPNWAITVAEWCVENDPTASELAKMLGVSRSVLHKHMAGVSKPSQELLDRLARIMERHTTTPKITLTKGDDK